MLDSEDLNYIAGGLTQLRVLRNRFSLNCDNCDIDLLHQNAETGEGADA